MAEEHHFASVWDPLRKKQVPLTPEERVRQWCIKVLLETFKVPAHMMMSEVSFKFGDKQYRADILVYGRDLKPLLVVECKRPEVKIDELVIDQVIRYNMALDVSFLMVTNGLSTYFFAREGEEFKSLDAPLSYEEMLNL